MGPSLRPAPPAPPAPPTRVSRTARAAAGFTAAAAVIAAVAGCQDYLFQRVCAEQIIEEEQTFAAARPKPADILFIVDNSGSMREEQQNLADNFGLFINEIAGAGDYRIAVVTTDQTSAQERTGLAVFTFDDEAPYFARIGFDATACNDLTIDRGCFRGDDPTTRVIDSDRPHCARADRCLSIQRPSRHLRHRDRARPPCHAGRPEEGRQRLQRGFP